MLSWKNKLYAINELQSLKLNCLISCVLSAIILIGLHVIAYLYTRIDVL